MLENIPSALHRGIFLSMLERADEQGQLTISVRGFADEIGVSYQVVRTAIVKLSANATINAVATQRLTQITICDYVNYTTPPRKQQRNDNATINAIATQIPPHPVSYTPSQTLDFQTIVNTLRADASWRESIQRTIGLTEMQIDEALERYPDHCITQGEPKKTLKEAKYHIANWLRRQKYSAPYETKRQDRFSERRGTNPSDNRPEDYTATL